MSALSFMTSSLIISCATFFLFLNIQTVFGSKYIMILQSTEGGGGSRNIIYPTCSLSENFTSNGTYATNLKELMDSFTSETHHLGFYLGSKGHGSGQVNGLGLCNVEVSPKDCATCFSDASSYLLQNCPHSKSAITWYDSCLFKYSNKHFFGQFDQKNQNKFCVLSVHNVSKPASFNQMKIDLLSNLASEASQTPNMHATGDVKLAGYKKIYASVQCTRDLSGSDCKSCLGDAISELGTCGGWRQGARVYTESCNVRYEIYNFYKG